MCDHDSWTAGFSAKMIPFLITFYSICSLHSNYINCQETVLAINQGLHDTIEEPIAITSNYKELVSLSRVFIDKSLLIQEILKDPYKLTLLVCPRKWGKTVNLDMIKTFLEIQVYENGKKITPVEDTQNYKLFKEGEIILANGSIATLKNKLLISKNHTVFQKYLGKHPVIFLDLRGLKKRNHQDFIEEFRKLIRRIYRPFRYILKQTDISEISSEGSDSGDKFATFDRSKFKRHLRMKSTEEELLHSVTFLSQVLKGYFKRDVYILVDEYLTLLYKVLLDTKYPDKQTTVQFYQDFIKITLTSNPHMAKGILTGILRQNSETSFDSQFMHERCFFDDPIFNFYGFQSREVGLLSSYFKFQTKKQERIHRWYGGYRSGANSNTNIANPWSVAHYINSRDFEIFWRDKELIEPLIGKLLYIPSFDNALCSLLTKKHYTIDEFRNLKYTLLDFEGIAQTAKNFAENKDISLLSTVDVVFKFLCMYGYLSLNNTYSKSDQYNVMIQMPSYEVRSAVTVQLSNYHLSKLGVEITPENVALFENLGITFKRSTTDNQIVCSQFEASVKNLLNIIPTFTRINRLNALNETIIKQNENVMISLFKYALINGDPLFQFIVSDQPTDILLTYKHQGVVLQIKPDVNGKMATGEEKAAYGRFFRNHGMKWCKLIQVFVSYKNSVRALATVFNEQTLHNT
ncbi:uncharacterized protein LOC135843666 [Planococcus citri]